LSDDQAVSGGSDNLLRDNLNLIYLEDAFDLDQEAGQQPQASSTHSYQRGDYVRGQNRVRKFQASRQPPFVQKSRHLSFAQGPELMHAADSEIKLREASEPLFDAGHADQHHADGAIVKDKPDIFKAVHVQPVAFIDQDQNRWISTALLSASKRSKVWR
jgi:hypothetical protein